MSEQQKNETTHLFATIGALIERGGRVSCATSGAEARGLALARVGDTVTYDDGREAVIIDGAGDAAVWEDKPLALVDSHLSNGDGIKETLQDFLGITVGEGQPIRGLFDSAYVVPSVEASHEGCGHA